MRLAREVRLYPSVFVPVFSCWGVGMTIHSNIEEVKENEVTEEATAPVHAKWHIVRTNHHQERRAKFYLTRQGFEVYLPMRCGKKPKDDQMQHHPLFPGYIFVRIPDLGVAWHKVFTTEGVKSVMIDNGKPYVLQRGEVEMLRAKEIDGLILIKTPAKPKAKREPVAPSAPQPIPDWVKEGQAVRVGSIEAVIEKLIEPMLDTNRIAILFTLFDRDVHVEVPLEGVFPL